MPTWLLNHRDKGLGNYVAHTPGDVSIYWGHYDENQRKRKAVFTQMAKGEPVVMRPLKSMGKKGKGDRLMHGKIIHKDMKPDYVPHIKDYCINNVTSWTSLSHEEQRSQIQQHASGWTMFVILWSPHTTPYKGEDKYKLSTSQVICEIN